MSLYDDASLALLTGAGAGKDGKLYVAKPAAEFGDELITNGGFDTDTDWTLTGSASISGGVANFGASGDYLITNDTPIPLSVKQYRIEYEVVSGNAGALRFAGGSSAFPTTTIPSTVGTHIVYVTSNGTQSRLQFNSVGFIGSIDNVSVKEVLVNADFEFTRGSNLAATRVNSDGLIEKGRENLLTYSNDLSQSVWTMSGANAIGGQSGYDGSNDAWTATGDVTDNWIFRRNDTIIQKSGVQTFSVYVKKNNDYGIRIYLFGSQNPNTYFNLSNGTVVQSSNDIDSKIEPIGNDWFRCSVTFNQLTNSLYIYTTNNSTLMLTNITQVFQDLQLEQGLVATEYIESGASTGKAGLLENEPRFDYSGGATCPSLLLEPQRVQLVPYTEYFEGTGWSEVGSLTLTTNTDEVTSPEGVNNAALLTSANATSEQYLSIGGLSTTSGQDYTVSIIAKKKDFDFIMLKFQGSGSAFSAGSVWFNLSTGAVATEDTGKTGHIKSIGNGWYKCSATATATGTTTGATCRVQLASADGTDAVTGDGSKGIYIFGAGFEQGSYPTSYIPNHSGGSVTRTQELCELSTGGVNETEGTFFIDYGDSPNVDALFASSTSHNTITNNIRLSKAQLYIRNGGGNLIIASVTLPDSGKLALKYSTSGVKIFANGGSTPIYESATSITFDGPIDYVRVGSRVNDSSVEEFRPKQFLIFPEALTDVECIKLTEL